MCEQCARRLRGGRCPSETPPLAPITIVPAIDSPVPNDHPESSHAPRSEPTTRAIERIAKKAMRRFPVATTRTPNATGKQIANPWHAPEDVG